MHRLIASSIALLLCSGAAAWAAAPPTSPRVVVIAFDGFDANLARRWMDEGRLPHLKRLADEGTFAPMPATNPSNSASASAIAMTGRNPGATGLFDFIGCTFEENGVPQPMLAGVHSKFVDAENLSEPVAALYRAMRPGVTTPLEGPHPLYVNDVAVSFFWQRPEFPAFVGLRVPLAMPPRARPGDRILAGLFMPDVAGGPGIWALYTNDDWALPNSEGSPTETGGRVFKLFENEKHAFDARVFGPTNFPLVEGLRLRMKDDDPDVKAAAAAELSKIRSNRRASVAATFTPDMATRTVAIELGAERHAVAQGAWSPWFHPVFELAQGYRVEGLARFYVNRCSAQGDAPARLEIYQLPIAYAPSFAGYPNATDPPTYAQDLARDAGEFSTLGWRTATNALKDGQIDAQAFVGSVELALEEDAKLLRRELAQKDWRCLFLGLGQADQAGHVMLELQPEVAAATLTAFGRTFTGADALREVYVACDRLVGEAVAAADAEDATVLVVSDHGIAPFRKEADVVTFLEKRGYMPEPLLAWGYGQPSPEREVAWSKAQAYALGLGTIRLNLVGREPLGIVKPEDRRELLERLRADLLAWTDAETGAKVVQSVSFAEEIYRGDYVANAADVILGFTPGYRVGWQNTLGYPNGKPTPDCLSAQQSGWTADHCSVDPAEVPGFFASNRKLAIEGTPNVLDLAPTIYAALGLAVPKEFEGRALKIASW